MEETTVAKAQLVGTEVVNQQGKYVFPDKTERFATQRTRFEGDKPVIEYVEETDNSPMRFALDGELFQLIVEAAKILVTEFKLNFSPAGMETIFVDRAHVGMEKIFVPREAFSEYNIGGRYLVVSLEVGRLRDLKIKKATGKVAIEIRKPGAEAKTEKQTVENIAHVYVSKEYGTSDVYFVFNNAEVKISSLDNSSVTIPKIPQISTDNYVIAAGADIRSFLDQAARVSDSCKFTLTENELLIRSVSDSEEAKVTLGRDRVKDIHLVQTGKIASSYPLEYLAKFFSAMRKSEDAKMSFKDDYPMTIEFSVKLGYNTAAISVVGMIAPRMEQ
jgi:proliferating cell nuclear antigen